MTGGEAKTHRKSWSRRLLLAGIVVVGAGAVWYATRRQPLSVILQAVERDRVEETVANTRAGTVKAPRRAKLAPSAGGQVARLYIREGDRVQEGERILELWNKDLAARVQLAKSQAVAARAKAEESCLLADQAAREAARARKLREDGIASEEITERAEANAEAARAACQAARAAAEQSASQIAVARADLEKTVLKAPFNGIVAKLNAELGEFITPSPPGIPTLPAVDLIEEGNLYVSAPLDEVDAPRVRPGLEARVTLDAFPGRDFTGKVRRVAPYVLDLEKQARTVDVEVDIENPFASSLLPGYSADVEVLLDLRDGVLRIPTEAILEGNKVLVFEAGTLAEREIRTGISNWEFTEVVSGLTEGERIVLSLDREGVRHGAQAVAENPQEAPE